MKMTKSEKRWFQTHSGGKCAAAIIHTPSAAGGPIDYTFIKTGDKWRKRLRCTICGDVFMANKRIKNPMMLELGTNEVSSFQEWDKKHNCGNPKLVFTCQPTTFGTITEVICENCFQKWDNYDFI